MRVALYARYSSKLQDEMSLEAQLVEMEGYVARQSGWCVTHRYLLPETRSADVERAEEFQSMVSAAKRREFDVLLVHKLDRFGRNRETSVTYKAMLRRAGVQVKSVVENLGDGLLDKLIEGILEVVAEFYSLNLGQEIRKGHRQLTRKGMWTGGKMPWGLCAVRQVEGNREHFAFAADPVKGPIMVEVFERVARGDRSGDVLEWVQRKTGERWSYATFYTRMKNPIYYGRIEYGRTRLEPGRKRQAQDPGELVEGSWEGLVSEELWRDAGKQLERRAPTSYNRKPARPYPLSALIKCEACGRHFVGGTFGKARNRNYVCAGRKNRLCPSRTYVDADEFDGTIRLLVHDMIQEIDWPAVARDYEEALEPMRAEAKVREAAMRRELTEVRRRMANLMKALEEGTSSSVTRRLQELEREEGVLATEIALCQMSADQAVNDNVGLVRGWLDELQKVFLKLDPAELAVVYQHLMVGQLDPETGRGHVSLRIVPPGDVLATREFLLGGVYQMVGVSGPPGLHPVFLVSRPFAVLLPAGR